MKKISNLIIYLIISFIMLFTINIISKEKPNSLQKTKQTSDIMGNPSSTIFNINNISTWIYNNGDSDNSSSGQSGFVFPKGSNKAAVFESGFVWGATVNGEKRVGGSTYDSGIVPGAISGGVAENPSESHVRIYRVRRNWSNVFAEIANGEGSETEIKAQYELDWNEWPANEGAPYEDVDGDGYYNPTKDIPGVVGAHQTIWYVANDLDVATCQSLYGSNPMGIEMQATFWGYSTTDVISNIMFRKYKLINKSSDVFDSMFVSMWSDPDIGDAGDDYSGCDTTLSMMYTYNGEAHDYVYGNNPPAVGFDFFQGPIIPSVGDTAIVDGKLKLDYKNLPMSAHYFFINGDDVYVDPVLGDYKGTIQFHRLFNGLTTGTGTHFTDPNTGEVTKFALAGDPVTGKGWIDGILHSPGDRRQGMVAGPFTMAVGDTQEVIVAELATFGANNLDAVTKLKVTSLYAQEAYNAFFKLPPTPPIASISLLEENTTVTLKWEQNSEIESFDEEGYQFQGYNIYQTSEDTTLLIRTFDKIDGIKTISQLMYDYELGYETMQEIQFGTDSGLEYELPIDWDYINNKKLLKGKSYYFAVSTYTYTADESKKVRTTESPSQIELIYRGNEDGLKYGDIIAIQHSSGGAEEGNIIISIYDESQITGQKYRVNFFKETDTSSVNYNKMLWKITNEAEVIVLDSIRQMQREEESIVVDGFKVFVKNIPIGIKDWSYDGPRWISGVSWGGGWLFGGLDMGFNFFGSTITDGTAFMDVQLKWAGVTNRGDESAATLAANSQAEDISRWSKGTSYARDAGYVATKNGDIPFAAYDMESDPPRRLNICFVEDANNGVNNLLWDMGWDGSKFASNGGREYTFIMASDYNEGADYDDSNFGPSSDVLYAIWPNARGSRTYLEGPFTLDILTTNPYSENDIFEFDSDKITSVNNGNGFPKEYSLSQNYPNPFNPSTTIQYSIPTNLNNNIANTKLIIYDILGRKVATLVNKVQKAGNYKVSFDARNLSSGVYIYRLQSGNFTKSVKMMLLK